MLDDRKFYYPISSHPPAEPAAPAWRRHGPLRHWTPMVADEFVTMDTNSTLYTGDHSPLVKLEQNETHGFMQSGLAVRNEENLHRQDRSGRQPDRDGESDAGLGRRSRRPADGNDLHTLGSGLTVQFPLDFRRQSDSDDARLEITGTGIGAFHVGAVSLMPADNIEGFRGEVIEALKQLHSGRLSLSRGQLCLRARMAQCCRRYRYAPSYLRSGLACCAAERCGHG